MVVVKVKPIAGKPFQEPKKATIGAAGFDLHSSEEGVVYPGMRSTFSCGFEIEVPAGFEAQVRSRSGMAFKSGIQVINQPGTIDEDYRGEVRVCLHNTSLTPFEVKVGDRIAQMVVKEVPPAIIQVVDNLSSTDRGAKGFGSTGL